MHRINSTLSRRCANFQAHISTASCLGNSMPMKKMRELSCHAGRAPSVHLGMLPESEDQKCQGQKYRYLCYILASESGRTYAGYTTDVRRRVKEHNGLLKGAAKATRGHGPWYLLGTVASPAFMSKGIALSFEWHCKKEHVPAALLRAVKRVGKQKATVVTRLAKTALATGHSKFAGTTFHVAVREDVLPLMDALLQRVALDQQQQQYQQKQDSVLDLKSGPDLGKTRKGGNKGSDMGGAGSRQLVSVAQGEAPKKKRGRPPGAVSKAAGSKEKGKSRESVRKARTKATGK
ncbi:hypothetical protein DUNSADRAFT_11470 [Dunaliella salina]|uniref:GIY-YIG domain-containing protein n=1 Tax=Dunaliella salina TaxID=3046 RepID=A0ABQ7GDB2_DUNSA|nr:hypothetical protein DUNSADRAFT_11470 [Dunaliella salina]|eukprot:KAF5832598.1 hypothetical protein DUNSADRAFT_11470 [Dunaliella salina]